MPLSYSLTPAHAYPLPGGLAVRLASITITATETNPTISASSLGFRKLLTVTQAADSTQTNGYTTLLAADGSSVKIVISVSSGSTTLTLGIVGTV